MIGSIGVISSGFGAHELMVRQDVERRIHTAGKSKSMLDPFSPEKPEDVERLKDLLEDIHTNFIDHVTARRGDKLDKDTELFTGQVWLAKKALALGLIDGIGHIKPMLKERFGDKVQLRSYGARRPLLARFGAQVVSDTIRSVEERAAYAQFGL
jgi:ClpP class serine protease